MYSNIRATSFEWMCVWRIATIFIWWRYFCCYCCPYCHLRTIHEFTSLLNVHIVYIILFLTSFNTFMGTEFDSVPLIENTRIRVCALIWIIDELFKFFKWKAKRKDPFLKSITNAKLLTNYQKHQNVWCSLFRLFIILFSVQKIQSSCALFFLLEKKNTGNCVWFLSFSTLTRIMLNIKGIFFD